MYRPKEAFTTAIELLTPCYKTVKGVRTPYYESAGIVYCTFKTFGGTEQNINGVYSIIDTANIETWYRPDITASSRIKLGDKVYEVIGEPENISMRNKYMKFKVKAIK